MLTLDLFNRPAEIKPHPGQATAVVAQPKTEPQALPVQEDHAIMEPSPRQQEIAHMDAEGTDLVKTLRRLMSANAELRRKLAHMRGQKSADEQPAVMEKDRTPGKISKSEDPCWSGYHMVGTKKKGGRTVPNCVPGAKGAGN